MNRIFMLLTAGILLIATGCKKEEFNFLSPSYPDIPVTVSNLYGTYNGVPTVATSVSGGGGITITMSIPAGSGRTIKEISRVGFANTTANYKVVEVPTGLYNAAPIAGNGTTVIFSTTLTEYTAKTGLAVTTSGAATSFLGRYFYFLITLDNGQQLIPLPVRVYVNS